MQVHQTTFLEAIRGGATVTRAAERAGVNRRQHSRWMEDEAYAAEYGDALQQAADRYEEEMDRRAVEGLVRFKFDRHGAAIVHPLTGEPYYEREYSDVLLMFRAKALRPETYGTTRHEHTGKGGGAIAVQHSTLTALQLATEEELAVLERIHQRALEAAKEPAT